MENDFLGLDLSLTSTGVFLKTILGQESFEIKTKPDQFENSILRCDHIAQTIVAFVNKTKPGMIAVEDYFAGRMLGSVIQLAELGTLVRYALMKNGSHFYTVAPTQLKKFCTSKGSGDKDNILKGVYKKWNVDVNSNNIADACVLAYIAEAIYNTKNGVQQTLLDYEKEVVAKILKERKMF